MRALFLAALASTGCNTVFGLEEGDLPEPGIVRGFLVENELRNDPQGFPLVVPLDIDTEPLTATFEDGSTHRVEVGSDGSFSFPTPTEGARYRLSTPSVIANEVQLSASNIVLPRTFVGRRGATPAVEGTTLAFTSAGAPPVGALDYFASTGRWSFTDAPPTPLDWSRATSVGTDPYVGLLDGAQGDRAYYLRYEGDPVKGLTFAIEDAIQMEVGPNFSMAPVAAREMLCTTVTGDRAGMASALSAALDGWEIPSSLWGIASVPAAHLSPVGGLLLAFANTDGSSPAPIDDVADYQNPFRGTSEIAISATSLARSYELPGAFPTGVAAEYRVMSTFETVHGGGCSAIELEPAVLQVPADVFVGGAAVSLPPGLIPEVSVPPEEPVVVTWAVDENDPAQVYTLLLERLDIAGAGATAVTVLVPVASALSDQARFELRRDLFEPGVQYVMALAAGVQYVDPSDLTSFTYPMTSVLIWTSPFTVRD